MRGSVHRGARAGLGQYERSVRRRTVFDCGVQGPTPGGPGFVLPQDAETRGPHHPEPGSLILRRPLVLSVAEEREVVVLEPAEEGSHLVQPLYVAESGAEIVDGRAHLLAHVPPVLDRRPHLPQDPVEAVVQLFEPPRLGLAIHLHVDERLVLGPDGLLVR